jgi:hypothetical protein
MEFCLPSDKTYSLILEEDTHNSFLKFFEEKDIFPPNESYQDLFFFDSFLDANSSVFGNLLTL